MGAAPINDLLRFASPFAWPRLVVSPRQFRIDRLCSPFTYSPQACCARSFCCSRYILHSNPCLASHHPSLSSIRATPTPGVLINPPGTHLSTRLKTPFAPPTHPVRLALTVLEVFFLQKTKLCVMALVERHWHRPHYTSMPYKYTPKRPRAQTLVLAVPTRPPQSSAPITPHPSYPYPHSQPYPPSQPQLHPQPHAGPNSAHPTVGATGPAPSSSHSHVSVSEILPRLYISDLHTAEDAGALSALGITHVLSVMPGHVALPPALAAHAAQVPLHDAPFAELAAHLPRTTRYIARALRSSPDARVLVHCAMGASRSVAVVCGYLIAAHGLHPTQALELVKARRTAAAPNRGFIDQLHEYHRSLGSGGAVFD